VNEKKNLSSFYCSRFSSVIWDGGKALVTILLHFPFTRLDSRSIFKNTVGQISIFGKIGN